MSWGVAGAVAIGLAACGGTGAGGISQPTGPEAGARTTASPTLSPDKGTGRRYVNKKAGFSVRPPTGWRPTGRSLRDKNIIFLAPPEGEYPTHLLFSVEPAQAGLDSWVRRLKQANKKVFAAYKLRVDKRVRTKNGHPAHLLGATFTQAGFTLRNLQVLLVDNDTFYVITGVAEQAEWESYENEIRSSLLTTRLN